MIPTLVLTGLESALNCYLNLDKDAVSQLKKLAGKILKIEITAPIAFDVYLQINSNNINLLNQVYTDPDATITGSVSDLAMMFYKYQKGETQVTQNVMINGDLHLVEAISVIFKHTQIDWEEHLSKIAGDVVARQVGNIVRNWRDWGKSFVALLQENTTEYIQEERRWLPPQQEIEDFYRDVHDIRNDVERLEARLVRLQNKIT